MDGIAAGCMDLAARLARLDHQVSKDRAYLNKTELRAQRAGRGGAEDALAGGAADAADVFRPL